MKSEYTIHRSEKNPENPYAQISRKMAQDSRLSFQARGLLLYVLSKPRAWRGKTFDLQREGGVKAKALKTIIDELIINRYVVRHETRNRRGRFDYTLEVFEDTALNNSSPCLTVPPSRGVGAVPPSRLPREGEHIEEGTGAGARPNLDQKELNTQAVCTESPVGSEDKILPDYDPSVHTVPAAEASQLPPGTFVSLGNVLARIGEAGEFDAASSRKKSLAARPGPKRRTLPKSPALVLHPVPVRFYDTLDGPTKRGLAQDLDFDRGEFAKRVEAWELSRRESNACFVSVDAMRANLRKYLVNCDLNKHQRRAS